MILDWTTHCYYVYKTREFARDDPSDNKSLFSQETHYLKYWILKGLDFKQIYLQWIRIKNGMAAAFKDDPEMQVATFGKIYQAAQNITEKPFKQHYVPIKIYQSEIVFLNNIKAPKWVKQYWLIMLIYWKFASQHTKYVEINTTLCNWAMRQTDLKDKFFGHHQDTIAQYNRLEDGYVLSSGIVNRRNIRNFWFGWAIEKSNEEFVEIKSLDKCKKALKLIDENTKICPKCGKKFIASAKSKTDLCPECYRLERRLYKTKKDFEAYHKEKDRCNR